MKVGILCSHELLAICAPFHTISSNNEAQALTKAPRSDLRPFAIDGTLDVARGPRAVDSAFAGGSSISTSATVALKTNAPI
jgi:hypothetical protein